MEKMRMESENYVYKKEIDWSTLMEGFTLPLDNQVIFLRNMENFLQRGQSKIIHFFMNGKTYDAIRWSRMENYLKAAGFDFLQLVAENDDWKWTT